MEQGPSLLAAGCNLSLWFYEPNPCLKHHLATKLQPHTYRDRNLPAAARRQPEAGAATAFCTSGRASCRNPSSSVYGAGSSRNAPSSLPTSNALYRGGAGSAAFDCKALLVLRLVLG
jgi:hypothetical protein